MGRLSLTAKAGIVLVAVPCLWLGTWALWHYTRTWSPVDIPISLSSGHIRTPVRTEFESDYAIRLKTRGDEFVRIPCPTGSGPCYLSLAMTEATWSVGSGGNVGVDSAGVNSAHLTITHGGAELGRFHADRGVYVLDLDLLRDLSALNSSEPHLEVVEDGGRYEASIERRNSALLFVFALVPIGLPMLILAAAARRRENWYGFLHQWAMTQPGPLPGVPRQGALLKLSPRREPRQVAARTFSVAGRFNINDSMLFLMLLLMLLWIIFVIQEPYLPHGFAIRTLRPSVQLIPTASIMPLRIRVLAAKNQKPWEMRGLQIGSQVIDRADFEGFLRREIPKRPPDWPVYIEGDSDLEYYSVAWAIDAVSAFRTKVVLLTPGMKADLGEPRAVKQ